MVAAATAKAAMDSGIARVRIDPRRRGGKFAEAPAKQCARLSMSLGQSSNPVGENVC